ncbi:hypothetical protein HanHA300_Chr08g0278221 [Helianthus annuus]|nr:hypothetical protein HanHA300_Chr08g0278221 [Helianthus annuus]KAJ0719022.1 hypothetical protein HanLR1_Chr08g0277111 [Helianthus annuus]KAJ0722267.1 hypothetical protein HanOQP8_Chr08g0284721 [Helianthus annuus]
MVCFFNCYMMIPHKTKRLTATLKWDSQFTTSWFYCSGNWGILSSLISYKGWYGKTPNMLLLVVYIVLLSIKELEWRLFRMQSIMADFGRVSMMLALGSLSYLGGNVRLVML